MTNVGPACPAYLDRSCERLDDFCLRDKFAEVLEDALDDASGKWETVAAKLDVDQSLLSKWASGRKNSMPAWRLISFTRHVSAAPLRWIARMCGYELVRIEKAGVRIPA